VHEQGVAYDREENSLGICALAAAIRSPSGELAAISLPVPAQRFEATEAALLQTLLKHVGRLQHKLSRQP
jgi:DNA-binding IclR family transcriptional regulator